MTRDEALLKLYESLTTTRAGQATAVRDMEPDARRAYMREAKARSRTRQRQASAEGSPMPTEAAVRSALADAAIMILAVDGPGAEQLRRGLAMAFPGRVGVPMTVQHRARTGELKPKGIAVPGTRNKSS